jgi:PAS domain S-box-containing protein
MVVVGGRENAAVQQRVATKVECVPVPDLAHYLERASYEEIQVENELVRIFDALPGLVWTAQPDGDLDFLNQRWCDYTGIHRQTAQGGRWHTSIHAEDLPQAQALWKSGTASGDSREMEVRLQRFDGEYRWFLIRICPMTDDSGHVVKWCGLNTDIDERKCAEGAVHTRWWLWPPAREQHFRAIIDDLPAHAIHVTPSGQLVDANLKVREFFNADRETLTAWKISDVVHREDLPVVLAASIHAVQSGELNDVECRLRRRDGVYRWFHTWGFPLRDAQDQIVLWYLLQNDIDDRKRAEALLAGEKRVLELVARGHSMSEVLEALCHFVQDTAGECYCSVVLLDAVGKRLEHGAAPSLPASFITAIIGREVSIDSGPCAMAAHLNQPIISVDIRTEARWAAQGWCPMALAHGLQACWSIPIRSAAGKVLGAFAIYYDTPRTPTPLDQTLIDQFTNIASIAIERQKSQSSLAIALNAVTRSEERLRTTIDAIPGFVWSATPDGQADFRNQAWSEYTGVKIESTSRSDWLTIIHPEDSDRVSAHWRSLQETRQPGEFEARLRRFDGTFRWFLFRAVPLYDDGENLTKWYGLNTDIEDLKRAESLIAGEKHLMEMVAGDCPLNQIEEALCDLVEGAVGGCRCSVLLVDPSGTRLQHGAAPHLPKSFTDSLHGVPLNVDSGPCAMAAHLNQQVISTDIVLETRWHSFPWCSLALAHGLRACWSTPIASKDGHVLGIFAIYYTEPRYPTPQHLALIDQITHIAGIAIERAQDRAALNRSEYLLAETRRLSQTGGASKRLSTGEITWSEEVYRIFELEPDGPMTIERTLTRVHPDDVPTFHAMLRDQPPGGHYEHEYRLLMPDQRIKYVRVVAHLSRDADGELEYIAAIQDVTQRRVSEEALSKARSELARVARVSSLGAVTASIAHEVNQPLGGIIANASACLRNLAAEPPNLDDAQESARRIIRDGNRAADVITRLRALFANKDAVVVSLDLNEVTRDVVALTRSELQRNRVILQSDLAADVPCIAADRVQLQQVILNLIFNASDAMSEVEDRPRELLITTRRDDQDRACLSVQDTGTGFALKDADQLFEAFYTTKSGGMGIGLSISRSLVESFHGRMWASPNVGRGATFSFAIPQSKDDAAGAGGRGLVWRSAVADVDQNVRSN